MFSLKVLLVLKTNFQRSNSEDILRFSSTCIYLPFIASIANLWSQSSWECMLELPQNSRNYWIHVIVILLLQYGRQLFSNAVLLIEETIRHLAFKYVNLLTVGIYFLQCSHSLWRETSHENIYLRLTRKVSCYFFHSWSLS